MRAVLHRSLPWVVLALMAVACSSPPGAAAVDVTLDEYSVDLDEVTVAPDATLTITNQGDFGHTVVVSDASGAVLTATDLIAPGEIVTLGAGWGPGEYRLTCRIVIAGDDGEIVDHYAEGMSADLTVTG